MSTFRELLSSKTKLKADARKLAISELEKLIKALNEVLAAEKTKAAKKEEAARAANIRKINQLLAETGLDPEDLKKQKAGKGKAAARTKAKAKGKRAKVKPKYRLVVDGKEHLWSGRGRAPRVFQAHLDAGNTKESCLIEPAGTK
ncbi:DNA-binding protein H-NS [Pseudohaliea rubra DSM 19751]|uniref:DNA-binding protein n=2 Tax=Pseudohaliea TaxID=1341120 RepID=A0A095WVZ6_9GAMM|nr:DNA-binding protein H-NS [Pseudohaliea rubra DSM 19751]